MAHHWPSTVTAHGIFRVNAKDAQYQGVTGGGDGKTEFGRVETRLGIEPIHALTPQAKGRVERANQTLQDRLVKEMWLEGISDIASAQAFMPRFMAIWNQRFAAQPRDPADAHRPWTQTSEALEAALARQEERVLSKALTFSTAGQLYCVRTKTAGIALRGARVTLAAFPRRHIAGHVEVPHSRHHRNPQTATPRSARRRKNHRCPRQCHHFHLGPKAKTATHPPLWIKRAPLQRPQSARYARFTQNLPPQKGTFSLCTTRGHSHFALTSNRRHLDFWSSWPYALIVIISVTLALNKILKNGSIENWESLKKFKLHIFCGTQRRIQRFV